MRLLAYATVTLWALSGVAVFAGGFFLMHRTERRLDKLCTITKADEEWLANFLANNRAEP